MAASSASSSDKSDEKKVDRDAFFSQLVARYNYCVIRHPILTKSVTRYAKLDFAILPQFPMCMRAASGADCGKQGLSV